MNAASGQGGFRGFASKLRDQAKDVVGNVKLPSFDDMAKNDDYIHSPDFNVRGRRPKEEEIITMNAETENFMNGTADEASNYSTESSWSLLDRSSNTTNGLVSGGKVIPATTSPATIRKKRVPEGTNEQGMEVPSAPSDSDRQTAKNPNVSLLSVVSDALQPTTPVQRGEFKKNILIRRAVDSDDFSDQSSEGFDEEDPILSIIRKENKNSNNVTNRDKHPNTEDAPASVITIKKSSNRFMEDVRLQAPVEQVRGVDRIIKMHPTAKSNSERDNGSIYGGPLSGFFKTTAIQNFKRIVLRKGPDAVQQRSPPPLARERTTMREQKDDNDGFQIKASTSVGILGDVDLERLKQLKIAGESSSALSSLSTIPLLVEYLGEHRQFLFVLFTLVLAIFIYFRQSTTSI